MEQQAQQERQVTLNLTINQLNTILAGVVKLPIEVGLDRLIKTADSMSQLVKYEVPSGGVKNILKKYQSVGLH